MQFRINYVAGLLVLALAQSAQAISFLDYYNGNEALGIPPHAKEIKDEVARGAWLNLKGKGLTDLNGFDEAHIPGLNKVESIILSDNQLTELPANIFHNLNMLHLDLAGNQLTTLPENIFHGLRNIRSIALSNNQITQLPQTIFRGLRMLLSLQLSGNQLIALPENIFHGLGALQNIVLSRNQITSLPENIFRGLRGLSLINLGSNKLTKLPDEIFQGLRSLNYVGLQDNEFTAISPAPFQDLAALKELDLYNNPLSMTTAQLMKDLHLGRFIRIKFNTWELDAAKQKLFSAIKNADVQTVQQIIGDITAERIGRDNPIAISKLRDANGDNLLHAAIRAAAERLAVTAGISAELPAGERTGAQEVLAEQKSEINDRYMKVISAILSCGEDCVQEMLFTPNAEGQMVIDAMIAKLGFDSPITQAIFNILTPAEEKKVRMEEAESSNVPRPKRSLEHPVPTLERPTETMADVEEIEQEEETEGRKRQRPSKPEEE